MRIIAATNQDLETMIEDGKFRGDLYHRLSQINLRVPALRERPEDILPLAEHFLRQLRPNGYFCLDAIEVLHRHRWPGNIRELRNVVTKVAVITTEDGICAAQVRPELMGRQAGRVPVQIDQVEGPNLDGIERRTIMKVLAQTNGHQQRAAELLGISRRTLSRKLKMYELESTSRSCAS